MPGQPCNRQRAFLYARVSSDEQEKEGYSIPAQQKLLRGYAQEKGLVIEREFVDVETAKKAGRTGFNQMVTLLRRDAKQCLARGEALIVLVEKTDRLYRNFRDWVTIGDIPGLQIHFVKEHCVISDDSHSSEKMVHGMKVVMAKHYIDNLSEETKKGLREKAEQGIWPLKPPIGYMTADVGGRRGIAICSETAPIVQRLYELYATGQYALEEVAAIAAADGLVNPKTRKPVDKKWAQAILTNPIYQGDFLFKGKLYRGIHQPIVTREMWAMVQTAMKQRSNKKPKRSRRDFAFAGLITCGHCGTALSGQMKKGKYVYYHCSQSKGKCSEPYVREEVLEAKFVDIIRTLQLTPAWIEKVRTGLLESFESERKYHDEAIGRLQKQYAALQKRIEAMYLDKLDGRIDAAFFEEKSREWRMEQDRCMEGIGQHQQADQRYMADGARLMELMSRAAGLFQSQTAREKRRLLKFVVSNSSWKNGELTVALKQPFADIQLAAIEFKQKEAAGASPDDLCELRGG